MSQQELYDIFFTGKDDIRDGCIMMGHVGKQNRPVYYHFVTEKNAVSDTRTTMYRDANIAIARLDWGGDILLGSITIGSGASIPMSYLVMPGTQANARMFTGPNGQHYEWRCREVNKYDLFSGPTTIIAAFERFPTLHNTPVGPAHAHLQCNFDNEDLIVYALLTLCLNRWRDYHGY